MPRWNATPPEKYAQLTYVIGRFDGETPHKNTLKNAETLNLKSFTTWIRMALALCRGWVG